MGCCTQISLPADVRVNDAAKVIGALVGFPKYKKHFQGSACCVAMVDGYEISNCENLPEMVSINLILETLDGQEGHYCFYHFEGNQNGERSICPPSTPFWIAVGLRLVKFFGGSIKFKDYTESPSIDVVYNKPRKTNFVEDGQEWDDFQQDILDIEPISKEDILQCVESAEYTDFDYISQFKEDVKKGKVKKGKAEKGKAFNKVIDT